MPSLTARDIDVLARTVYGEARGEGDLGMLAVAWVVVNRARKYRLGIAEACLKSIHFSCWNNARENDANQLSMMTADIGDKLFARAMQAALEAAHGLFPDPTEGATHYFNPRLVRPDWASGHADYVTIGNHRFYKGID